MGSRLRAKAGRAAQPWWRSPAYALAAVAAVALFIASLAFTLGLRPLSTGELAIATVLQTGAIAAFAAVGAALVALGVVGPLGKISATLRSAAEADGRAAAEHAAQRASAEQAAQRATDERAQMVARARLRSGEFAVLADSTHRILERLARSERERATLQATLEQHKREQLALQATLESKVEERTARLLEANEQIAHEFDARAQMELDLRQAQRLEAVGRLAAGIAHEINTPVQFVSDSLGFVREGIGELLQLLERDGDMIKRIGAGESARELAAAAAEAAETADLPYLREQLPLAIDRALDGLGRVSTIVRAMKNHAHPDRREMAAIDLNEAIASTLTIARNEYKYVADLETEFGKLPLVTCFVGDFNQVIINLVVNAAHAIGDLVGNSGQKGKITVKTWTDEPDVVVAIEDTGGGIPEYIRDYIFEPFFTTKELGKGTGQGLTIARAVIVEKHGGSLTFESRPGGTVFLIRIPIAGAAAMAGHAA